MFYFAEGMIFLDKKSNFKLSKQTIVWTCIIAAAIILLSVSVAENISSKNENTYSIETSKLHIYN